MRVHEHAPPRPHLHTHAHTLPRPTWWPPPCSTSRLEELKQRYVKAGSPLNPDWDKMMEGL